MYKVCYVATSRADYERAKQYLKYLNTDKEIELHLLLTGAILDSKYGSEYEEIKKDNFKIAYSLQINNASKNETDITDNMAIILKEFGRYFNKNKYDLVIIFGDRYEMLSVAISAAMNKLKILHIHGGELTLGNYDEFVRHCITKLSKYHFTSTEVYRKRVIQLGEEPDRVFNIGAMSLENCNNINIQKVSNKILALKNMKYFVVLYHPETMTNNSNEEQTKELLQAIDCYKNKYMFIFIGSNADNGSNEIREAIKEYVKNNDNTLYFENMNSDSYYFLVKNSIALIGNSSSGIIEAPTLGCYSINIGERQMGRVRAKSVIDVKAEKNDIKNAIEKVINLKKGIKFDNPYYKENSVKSAYEITKVILSKKEDVIKKFYDLN